ncbi:MAG: hypothetical protein H0T94_13530 [Acidimicrobiia bacterium]|nr:hypothetical protein [Acidimicrobiia bacterium]MDQ3499751.1 hypothetical protein [Actinomycetota bacterium]
MGTRNITKCPAQEAKEPRREEKLARELLRGHIAGELIYIDPPDFVVCRDGAVVGAVEVTRATDEETNRLQARLDRDGRSFLSDRLRSSWIVTFKKSADLLRLDRQRLVDALWLREQGMVRHALEAGNRRLEQRIALEAMRDERQISEVFETFGIDFAAPWNESSAVSTVHLSESGHSAAIGPVLVNRLAEAMFLRKEAVLRSQTGERHLFVWVDPWEPGGAGLAMGGIGEPDLPDEPPTFPSWVTDVWMASTFGRVRLWHCSTGEQWAVLP